MTVTWGQIAKNRLILKLNIQEQEKVFLMDDSVVNFLAETKHVHLHIHTEGQTEQSVLVNFTGIKPLVANHNAMGPGKTIGAGPAQIQSDRLAIARGETFASKWLTPKGWDREKHYFPLKPYTAEHEIELRPCPACGKSIRKNAVFCGYCGIKVDTAVSEKKCHNNKCGKTIKPTAVYCPYCGQKQ